MHNISKKLQKICLFREYYTIFIQIFGLEFKKSLAVIAIGVFIAGVIVATLCLLGWVGAVIAGIGLAVLAAAGFWRL